MDLEEAKSVTRATLDTSTMVIVATRQAFQVEEEECRKVYQSQRRADAPLRQPVADPARRTADARAKAPSARRRARWPTCCACAGPS